MPRVVILTALTLLFSCLSELYSLTSPGAEDAVRLNGESQVGQTVGGAACPSCALSQLEKDSMSSDPSMVEAVKKHILNMLHLSAPPNISQPVPRAALLNALRKLHVGRISQDGTVEIEEEREEIAAPGDEQPSEMITFAERADVPNVVKFNISKDSSTVYAVDQASVWIFLKLAKGSHTKGKVILQLLQSQNATTGLNSGLQEDVIVSEKKVDARRSGWHTLSVGASIQRLLDNGGGELRLRVSCPLCADLSAKPVLGDEKEHAQSHRPFLMVAFRPVEEHQHRRNKRGLECDGKMRACCKRHFYVNFKDIGWSDWIIAPSGYHANYCEGECPGHAASMAGSALSFHSTVINHYRMRGYSPFAGIRSCCVPTRLRAMSMLYYNEEQKIIKKDIQNMIVEECGCS